MIVTQITGMRSTKYGGMEKFFVEIAKVLYNRGDTLYIQYNEEPASNQYKALLKQYGAKLIISNLNNVSTLKLYIKLYKIIF